MATKTFLVAKYSIDLFRAFPNTSGGHAGVRCSGPNGELFDIIFYPPDIQPANNRTNISIQPSENWGVSYLPASEYVWYVDLLRNEHPVNVTLDDQNPEKNRIWCSEPAGEGENFFRPPV
jgi:hypothetical protein